MRHERRSVEVFDTQRATRGAAIEQATEGTDIEPLHG